jgi:hypothetical protein
MRWWALSLSLSLLHTRAHTPVFDNLTVIYVLVMKQICTVLKFAREILPRC